MLFLDVGRQAAWRLALQHHAAFFGCLSSSRPFAEWKRAVDSGKVSPELQQRYAELQHSWLVPLLRLQGYEERLLADPSFMVKVGIEVRGLRPKACPASARGAQWRQLSTHEQSAYSFHCLPPRSALAYAPKRQQRPRSAGTCSSRSSTSWPPTSSWRSWRTFVLCGCPRRALPGGKCMPMQAAAHKLLSFTS